MKHLVARVRARPFTSALLVMLLAVVPGTWRLEMLNARTSESAELALAASTKAERASVEAKKVAADLVQEAVRADQVSCGQRRDTIIILRQLIELTRATGGALALTQVPGFDQLTPATQTYLRNLEAASKASRAAGDPEGFYQQALALLVVPDCPT